jgi:hypothetical protein
MEKSKIVLLDIDDTLFKTDLFYQSNFTRFEMYDEVHSALKELSKIAIIGIFSQGELAFQHRKLVETNILHYLVEEHIHIVENKIQTVENLLKTYKDSGKIFFIEDRLDILRLAKLSFPSLTAIWMKRGRYVEKQKEVTDYTPDYTIENLLQSVPIIAA